MTDNVSREMTFEEEAKLYKEETAEFRKNETVDSEPPFVNSVLRRGNRIIRKASDEIEHLQSENTRLRKELEHVKAERDKAVEDLIYIHCAGRYGCIVCFNNDLCKRQNTHIGKCEDFTWRGLEESE